MEFGGLSMSNMVVVSCQTKKDFSLWLTLTVAVAPKHHIAAIGANLLASYKSRFKTHEFLFNCQLISCFFFSFIL